MAKINVSFNNKNYKIDESALSSASAALKSHLSTVMNGTDAIIKLGGATYSIDSTKLSAATNAFVADLGKISGTGSKVVVNGQEYNIGTDKIASAVADLKTVLGILESGGGEQPDDSNSIFPIQWNTMAVIGNASCSANGMTLVKVSDKVPSCDEMSSTSVSGIMNGERMELNCIEAIDFGTVVIADYGDFICMSASVAGEFSAFGVTIPETGFYALDLGSMTGMNIDMVLDATDAPSAPVAETITGTSVVLVAMDGCEYSIDGMNWQDSPVFTDLDVGTEYTFYARYKATGFEPASAFSKSVITTLSGPYFDVQNVTTTTITLYPVNDCEFSLDCVTWQTDTTFTGLNRDTDYVVYARYTSEEAGDTSIISSKELRTKEYIYFSVTPNNRVKVGYTGSDAEELVIPATFYDSEDNEWYEVATIDSYAFNGTSIKSVVLSDGVCRIEHNAFASCTNLTSIAIPASVTWINSTAFADCPSLTRFTVDANNKKYSSDVSGVLFDKDMKTLILAPQALSGSYMIPHGVETVSERSFFEGNLTEVIIPNSVKTLGVSAFASCYNLSSVTFGNSVEVIDYYAFYHCDKLEIVNLPDSVISIGAYAFKSQDSDSGVRNITIPASVTSIGAYAFKRINPSEGSIVFENPDGWWYADSAMATSGTAISATDLADETIAATYLAGTYANFYWFRGAK